MTYLLFLLLSLSATAQQEKKDIEELRATMYRLFNTDSIEKFMAATDHLKALCRKTGDEQTFYKAWCNQAFFTFRKINRSKGLDLAKEIKAFAEQEDSKYGLYSATSINVKMLTSMKQPQLAEKGYYECIDYLHRFFPNESAAINYIGLCQINYNKRDYQKMLELARKGLQEPNLEQIHRHTLNSFICIALSKLNMEHGINNEEEFENAYQEWKQGQVNKVDDNDIYRIVEFNHAKIKKDYEQALAIAKTIVSPQIRLNFMATAYRLLGDYKTAYNTYILYKLVSDSVSALEVRKMAAEHSLQLDLARSENEKKDLNLANQALQLEHISDELVQRRLKEEALNLSLENQSIELRNRDIELQNVAVKLKNDSLDKYNKDLKLSEWESKMEAQKQKEHSHHVFMYMLCLVAAIIISALGFILHRHKKHEKAIETAYEKLENAYGQLEETTKAKERIESELRIARDIQMSMVPRNFNIFQQHSGVDLYASMKPAKEVGGDLYDFFMQNNKLFLCIGDVSGKGVPASMTMAVAVNLFHNYAKEGFPPEYTATRLNDTLAADNESGMFVTMFIAEIDLTTGQMKYCNAGHNPPIIIDPPLTSDGPCRPSFAEVESNAPIGLWPDLEFVGESIDNLRGRTLFLYTDGLNEAENSFQEQFGDKRLLSFFQSRSNEDCQQIVSQMNAAVSYFVGDAEPSDDLTMLCLKIS
jgi:serine phosphatase RsbU (regulator of sigma subunit)